MWKIFNMREAHLSPSEDTIWNFRPLSLVMLNVLPLKSFFNKNPFCSPIIYWRKEKQEKRTTETEQKRKQLLLYLLLPQHQEAGGPCQVFCGQSPRAGRSHRVLQQPQAWGPEFSERFHQEKMTGCEESEDTAQMAASSPSHTGRLEQGRARQGKPEDHCYFSQSMNYERNTFYFLFSSF